MSYSFEGKIANQYPKTKALSGVHTCSKCNKIIPKPKLLKINIEKRAFIVHSYLEDPYYIYESNSGNAVIYCSRYCVRKHNHRFNNVKKE